METQLSSNEEFQSFLLERTEELKKIALSNSSIFVFKHYGINLLDSFPIELVENQNFLEKQWPNIKRWFNEKIVINSLHTENTSSLELRKFAYLLN